MRFLILFFLCNLLYTKDFDNSFFFLKSKNINPIDDNGFFIKGKYKQNKFSLQTLNFFDSYKKNKKSYVSFLSKSWSSYIISVLDDNKIFLKNFKFVRILDIKENEKDIIVLSRIVGTDSSLICEIYYTKEASLYKIDDIIFNKN